MITLVSALLGANAVQAATTDCARVPKLVTRYVNQQTGWHMLTTADLDTDRNLWSQGHPGQCPGFVSLHFDASKNGTYAVALVRQIDNVLHERLELLHLDGQTVSATSPTTDWDVSGPWVIFKAKPGTYTNIETDQKITTHFDGVVFEQMESADHLYYMDHGRLNDVMLSD